jgi:hypothetical protein
LSDDVLRSEKYRLENRGFPVNAGDVEVPPSPKKGTAGAAPGTPKPTRGKRTRTTTAHYSPEDHLTNRRREAPSKRPRVKKSKKKVAVEEEEEEEEEEEVEEEENEEEEEPPRTAAKSSTAKKKQKKEPKLTATKQLLDVATSLANQVGALTDRISHLEQSSSAFSPAVEHVAAPQQVNSVLHSMPAGTTSSSLDNLFLGVLDDQAELQRLQCDVNGLRRSLRARQLGNVARSFLK